MYFSALALHGPPLVENWPALPPAIVPLWRHRRAGDANPTQGRVKGERPLRQDPPVRDQTRSIWQSAKQETVAARRRSRTTTRRVRHRFAKYSAGDWFGWLQCVWQFIRYAIEAGFPQYNDWSQQQPPDLSYGVIEYRLPSVSKVLMIGDWGTHMTDNVALLRQALKKFTPDTIIHLGDVYYSGTRQECMENVIEVLDELFAQLPIKRPPFFTLAGNHDYYSGGHGFYEMIGKVNTGLAGCEQKASYFCLRTADDRWQFLGMDTGYNDRNPISHIWSDLVASEVTWHCDKLDHFGGTTILLSHHQLYSAKERLNRGARPWLNEDLHRTFEPYFDRVAAWFWGHEHNLIIFRDKLLVPGAALPLRKGRLVGCSAYEATKADDPFAISPANKAAAFMDKMPRLKLSRYRGATQRFYDHAFALLEISPQRIKVSYYEYPSWDQDHAPPDPDIAEPLFVETLEPIERPRAAPHPDPSAAAAA